jgi:hypothetical protein
MEANEKRELLTLACHHLILKFPGLDAMVESKIKRVLDMINMAQHV